MRSRFRGDIRRRRSSFRRAGTRLAEHKEWPGLKAMWLIRRARNRGCCQIRRLPGWNCPALCWSAYSGWLRPGRPQAHTGRPERCCHMPMMRWKRWECKTRCPPSVYLRSDYRLQLPASWEAGPIGCNLQEAPRSARRCHSWLCLRPLSQRRRLRHWPPANTDPRLRRNSAWMPALTKRCRLDCSDLHWRRNSWWMQAMLQCCQLKRCRLDCSDLRCRRNSWWMRALLQRRRS